MGLEMSPSLGLFLSLQAWLGLASVLQDPWSCRHPGSGRKQAAQSLVAGPISSTDFPPVVKESLGRGHRAAGAVLWGFGITVASLPPSPAPCRQPLATSGLSLESFCPEAGEERLLVYGRCPSSWALGRGVNTAFGLLSIAGAIYSHPLSFLSQPASSLGFQGALSTTS